MIANVLGVVWSMPFLVGGFAGALLMKLYQLAQCRHLDKVHPLPDGRKRHVPGLNRTWAGGLLTLAVVVYVLLQVSQTEAHYKSLGNEMRRCQIEFQTALIARSEITRENDQLSRDQREALADYNDATSSWINRLINPPQEIADLDTNNPRRQSWGLDVTRVYFERTARINKTIADISHRQQELDVERARTPLPALSCGK